ncbi:MAG: hypothetical protein V7749_12055 [Cocleimonas sp.]|jgi:hypothetical protein
MAGEVVERTGVELSCFQLVEAKQEVRLSGELIADVMSQSAKDETLAVEIFYQPKGLARGKKYRSAGIDAIEIDLSTLPWNVNRNELRKAVLQTENRRWLSWLKERQMWM